MGTSPFDQLKEEVEASMPKGDIVEMPIHKADTAMNELAKMKVKENTALLGALDEIGQEISPELLAVMSGKPTKADKVLQLLDAPEGSMAELGLTLNEKPLTEKLGFDPEAELEAEPPKVKELQDGFMFKATKTQAGTELFQIDVQLTDLDTYLVSASGNAVMTRAEIILLRKNLKKVMNMEKNLHPDSFPEDEEKAAKKAKKQAKKAGLWTPDPVDPPENFDDDFDEEGWNDVDLEGPDPLPLAPYVVHDTIVTKDMPEGKFTFIETNAGPKVPLTHKEAMETLVTTGVKVATGVNTDAGEGEKEYFG